MRIKGCFEIKQDSTTWTALVVKTITFRVLAALALATNTPVHLGVFLKADVYCLGKFAYLHRVIAFMFLVGKIIFQLYLG